MEKGKFREGLLANMLPDSLMKSHTTNYMFHNQGNDAEIQIQGIDLRGSKLPDDMLSGSSTELPTEKLVGENTAKRKLRQIEDCLLGHEVRKIGVYGMGGVGKTTIMTHIHNKMIEKKRTFDNVIWVTVSKYSNLEELQDRVLDAFSGRSFKSIDALSRSAELLKYFKKKGKFLLILDDVWSRFSLKEVGIPEPNEENKCKIVWTTRSKSVCEQMESQRTIEVGRLTKEESWTLFKEKLRRNRVLSPEIESIAKNIVEECDGLPLAIVTVGASMSSCKGSQMWSSALDDLKNSRPKLGGLEDDVFTCLRFSFDNLKTQRHRDCFLYCALYPEDSKISYRELIENWIAEGFFDELENRKQEFDKGYTIINDLKDACMLESVDNRSSDQIKYVKMHDVLRDLAIFITSKSPRFFVRLRMQQFPGEKELLDNVVRISLIPNDMEMATCQANCPKLSTLLMGLSSMLGNIDDLFFQHMQNLRVLDLSHAYEITHLPQSLSHLLNLRALNLSCCQMLKEVPSLVKLGELRFLDLSETAIQYLPEGMNGLTNLRYLNLSFNAELEMFPVGIIPNLSQLEDFFMEGGTWKWSSNRNGAAAGVEEIARLTHLRKLLVDFMDLTALSSYVRFGNWRNLECFSLIVRREDNYPYEDGCEDFYSLVRKVRFNNIHECLSSLVVPDSTRFLCFNNCSNIPPLSEIPYIQSLNQLDICEITTCGEMEYIVTKEENPFLSGLSKLQISDLNSLKTICKELTHGGSTLANLKSLILFNCPNLEYVFSVGWLQTLRYLEDITISDCKAMENMVVQLEDIVEANNIAIELPRLKRLAILRLPELKTILKNILICTSLETISVLHCPNLDGLPFHVNNIPPSLKQIYGSLTWWNSLQWDDINTKLRLQCFRKDMEEEEEEEEEEDDDDDDDDDDNDNDDDDDDDDSSTGYATAEDGEQDEVDDNEKETHGTKSKAHRVSLSTWISSCFIVGFLVFVFLSRRNYSWFDLTYVTIEDVPPT